MFRMRKLGWVASLNSELCCYNLQNDVVAALARALDRSSPGFTSCILTPEHRYHACKVMGMRVYCLQYNLIMIQKTTGISACPLNAEISPDGNRPVISLWDGGIHMIGKKPFVLFAAWSDGMVVQRIGDKEKVGYASKESIAEYIRAIKKAGFFEPPIKHGL